MILRLEQAGFTYPGSASPALRDCDLELDTSKVTVLIGSNGAGKSTLIRLLTGQLIGYSGRYAIDGREPDLRKGDLLARHRFGYVPDVPVLEPHLTGLEMLRMAASFRGIGEARVPDLIRPYAEMFEMGDWLEGKSCDAYSKGMRKKVSLTMGLFGDLAYTFLDEPFDGLDPISIHNLKRHLRERLARGAGVLLSSHMLDVAEKVADDVVLLKGGWIVYAGGFQALLRERPDGASNLEEIYFKLFMK
jgi:ABC-2 type transport system ATP-binding protein